jgi:hypothetical protein
MGAMTAVGETYEPAGGELRAIHQHRAETYGLLQSLMRTR